MTTQVAIRPLVSGQADALFRSILTSVEFGIMVTDLNHVALACNGRFGELWGVDIEQVVNSDPESVRLMVGSRLKDYEGWLRNLDEVYADPHLRKQDTLVLSDPDLVLNRSASPVYDSDGFLAGRIWTFSDVTQANRLQRMRDLIHAASTEYDADPSFIYRRIIERVGAFYGSLCLLSIQDNDVLHFRAAGGPGADNLPIQQNNLVDSYCQFCLAVQTPLIIQDARTNPTYSELLPAHLGLTRYAGVPIFSPEGGVLGTLCVMDGRSDEPLDDEDLRFLQVLGVRIGSELGRERQLKRLQRDLEESQQHLIENEKLAITGTLSASVAHDIRNILSTISLQVTMGADDDTATLSRVKSQLERFDLMAHRLLSYARPQRIMLQAVDVREVVNRVVDLLRVHLKIAGTEVRVEIGDDIPTISADPARLDHLFVNLGLNAIQAMARGGTLTFRAVDADEFVAITVEDNGPGMTDEQIDGMFAPFRSTKTSGFGLGLFSCRQITRECGGELEVLSTIGQGSQFIIRLRKFTN